MFHHTVSVQPWACNALVGLLWQQSQQGLLLEVHGRAQLLMDTLGTWTCASILAKACRFGGFYSGGTA